MGRIKEENNALYIASYIHVTIYLLYQPLPPSIHTLASSQKLQGTLEGKHVSNWGRNPGRPVFLAQARTANTCYHAHKASSEWQLIRSALQRPPLLHHAPSSHLSSHLIWSISILFSVLFVLLSGSVAQLRSETVELSPGGPHLRGLTAACIISPFAWILIGPDQRAGGGWRRPVGDFTIGEWASFKDAHKKWRRGEKWIWLCLVWRWGELWGMYKEEGKVVRKTMEDKEGEGSILLAGVHLWTQTTISDANLMTYMRDIVKLTTRRQHILNSVRTSQTFLSFREWHTPD